MRALIADDDKLIRTEVGKTLEGRGFACYYAENGIDALKLGLARRYDIILSDITMPGLDGLKFVHRIRHSEMNGDTPVLMLTSRTDRDAVTRALDIGVQGYILKPVQAEDLMARVLRALPPNED
jgi:DNA-binding response OmpR family regulator